MSYFSSQRPVRTALLAAVLALTAARGSSADELVEWLFWNEIGNAAGAAADSYADYVQERQLWAAKIAEAKAELERCGGCASAQAELDKWQGIENQFQEFAGSVFQSVGMPPVVAQALGINMPLAPRRSPQEWEQMCEIIRRDWIDQRPDFCRAAADEHLACIRDFQRANGVCSWRRAEAPGGACWNTSKLSKHCYSEDYGAFEREKKAQAARASGAIIPEYTQESTTAIILYGRVPEDFVPALPSAEVVEAKLGEEHTTEIRFVMEKSGLGQLGETTIKEFIWHDVAPEKEECFQPDAQLDGFGERICEDLSEMTSRYRAKFLACYYNLPRQLTADSKGDAIYWYGARPQGADLANLLGRAPSHPLLDVGEPRTDCPATIDEAKAIDARYRATLANLRAQVAQVPQNVALRSEWHKQRQAEHDTQVGTIEEARAALADFPLLGTYTFELTGTWGSLVGECTIAKDRGKYSVSCVDEKGGTHSHRVSLVGDQFSVSWYFPEHMRGPAIVFYMVDLGYHRAGQGDALVSYYSDSGSVRGGRLIRMGAGDRSQNENTNVHAPVEKVERAAPLEELGAGGTARPGPVTNREVAAVEPQTVPVERSSPQTEPTAPAPRDANTDDRSSTSRVCTVESIAGTYGSAKGDIVCKPAGNVLECCHGKARCLKMLYLELTPDGRNLVGRWEQQNGAEGPAEFGVTENCELTRGHLGNARNQVRIAWNVAGKRQSVTAGLASPQTEPTAPVPADQKPGEGASPSVLSACAAATIAGTYASSYGPIVCEPGGTGLECCYGGSCRKRLHLGLARDGRSLTGEWRYQNGQNGPAEFGLTESCELTDGRWGYASNPANQSWKVAGRK